MIFGVLMEKLKIKAEGEKSQAAYNIFNKPVYMVCPKQKKCSQMSYKQNAKFSEWFMWFFIFLVLFSILSSPFIRNEMTAIFSFVMYIIGFIGFFLSALCAMFFNVQIKKY